MDTHAQPRSTLRPLLAVAGLALMLGAIPAHAQTIIGLGPSSSGSISLVFNGTGNPIDVTFPTDLSGTSYEFDSVGGTTVFSPAATDLTPFSSSDQDTTVSLGGGSPVPVTWVDIGGGGLSGIVVLQFTIPDQYPGTYDDLVLNVTSASVPFIDSVPPSLTNGGSPAEPNPVSNICDPAISSACNYNAFVSGSGIIVTSYSFCGFPDITVCANGTEANPVTANAAISSGEAYLADAVLTPEPSSLSLLALGLISILGSAVVRRKISRS
jgi:hypothetical protein